MINFLEQLRTVIGKTCFDGSVIISVEDFDFFEMGKVYFVVKYSKGFSELIGIPVDISQENFSEYLKHFCTNFKSKFINTKSHTEVIA